MLIVLFIVATISLVLEQIPTLLNHQASDRSTALHIAASLNRIDAVQILLSQQLIDDTILDSNGSTCIDEAATIECSSVISRMDPYCRLLKCN